MDLDQWLNATSSSEPLDPTLHREAVRARAASLQRSRRRRLQYGGGAALTLVCLAAVAGAGSWGRSDAPQRIDSLASSTSAPIDGPSEAPICGASVGLASDHGLELALEPPGLTSAKMIEDGKARLSIHNSGDQAVTLRLRQNSVLVYGFSGSEIATGSSAPRSTVEYDAVIEPGKTLTVDAFPATDSCREGDTDGEDLPLAAVIKIAVPNGTELLRGPPVD